MKEALLLLFILLLFLFFLHFPLLSAFSPPSFSPSSSPNSPSPSPPFLPPPPPPTQPHPSPPPPGQQLDNIIDALIGAADFWNWANIFSAGNLSVSATLFIPRNNHLSNSPTLDPFVFPYHIVPQRLSFSDLQFFKTYARLPTLLPGKSILITNNSRSNFTIDDSSVILPDLYLTSSIAVHGIEAILNYSLYGDDSELLLIPSPQPEVLGQPKSPEQPEFLPAGSTINRSLDSACLSIKFLVLFLAVCDAYGRMIHHRLFCAII